MENVSRDVLSFAMMRVPDILLDALDSAGLVFTSLHYASLPQPTLRPNNSPCFCPLRGLGGAFFCCPALDRLDCLLYLLLATQAAGSSVVKARSVKPKLGSLRVTA